MKRRNTEITMYLVEARIGILTVFLLLFSSVSVKTQTFSVPQQPQSLNHYFSNEIQNEAATPIADKKRSIPLAFIMSAVVPGAGQAYNRQWIKTAIFAGIEAGTLITQTSYNRKGEDGEIEYQNYAHEYWSPVTYTQWLNDYSGYNGPDIIPPSQLASIDFGQPESWTADERKAVMDLIDEIRQAERSSVHVSTGAAFSHQLPYFGEQQYYELIGKYYQYAPGWADYNGADDPEEEDANGRKINASNRFLQYADDHGKANEYLRKASRLSAVLLFNHFIAAIDAAISAKLHNNRIDASVSWNRTHQGELVPVMQVAWKF